MKSLLRQQDITDYALNELEPRERLYVESMMLGSEESREDVQGMIDLARMLEEGFEAKNISEVLELGAERRGKILSFQEPKQRWGGWLQVAVAVVVLFASAGFGVVAPKAWRTAFSDGGIAERSARGGDCLNNQDALKVQTAQVNMPTDEEAAGQNGMGMPLLPTGNVEVPDMSIPSLILE